MKTRLFTLAALALTMASCSQDGDNTPVDLKDTPIQVNASVSPMASLKDTKAGYEASTSLPSQFYLTILNSSNNDYSYNAMMKNADSKWTSYTYDGTGALKMNWADNTTHVTVKAATFDFKDKTTVALAVVADQSSDDNVKQSDHLMMSLDKSDVTPNEAGLSVTLDHLMAKIVFTLKLSDEFDAKTVEPSDIKFAGTKLNGTLTMADASWAVSGDAATITPYKTGWTAPTANATGVATYEAIVAPQTVEANGFTVTFNVGTRSFTWTYDKQFEFKKGIKYDLTLTAGDATLSKASFTTTAFGGDSSTSSITAK